MYTYRRRAFLNSISTEYTSFIQATVESSNNGTYELGNYLITIADCRHIIRLEFVLSTKENRRLSLKKINLLTDILARFRDALTKEIALIEKAQSGKS